MNPQEIYNKIKQHLLSQNERSITIVPSIHDDEGYDVCAYRSDDGNLKCAVGALITDDAYSKELEDKSWYNPVVAKALVESGVKVEAYSRSSNGSFIDWVNADPIRKLLDTAQHIHDAEEVELWQGYLESLATELGLEP